MAAAGLWGALRRALGCLFPAKKPSDVDGVAPPPPEPALPDEPLLPAAQSSLYRVLCRISNRPSPGPEDSYRLSEWMEDGAAPDTEQAECLARLEREAERWLQQADGEEAEPAPARAVVFVAAGRMQVWAFVLPPVLDGPGLEAEALRALLQEKGVVYGVSDEKLDALCAGQRWMTLLTVAEGTPPADGEDGRVVDHFLRQFEIRLSMREDGTIDYKDLGWLQVVNQGDVICDILPPTEATEGSNVLGVKLSGRNGARAKAPKGQNTTLSEDGTALVAAIDGVVSFVSGSFRVDPLLIIKGNVDIAVGSLDVVGDVLVYGDVLEGFEVKATGNVTVQGMAEGALLEAGGDIQVGAGMNGNTAGTMKAGGEVRCKFIENANVEAGRRVVCDNIVNSVVASDSDIEVKTGRGAVIGGSITARRHMLAKTVGNLSSRSISITLGNSAEWLRQKRELAALLAKTRETVDELQKNIRYLASGQRAGEAGSLLGDLKLSHSVQQLQLAKLQRRLEEMDKQEVNNADCRLRAEVIYPPAQVMIGDASVAIKETRYNAMVYLKDGEVHVANV